MRGRIMSERAKERRSEGAKQERRQGVDAQEIGVVDLDRDKVVPWDESRREPFLIDRRLENDAEGGERGRGSEQSPITRTDGKLTFQRIGDA